MNTTHPPMPPRLIEDWTRIRSGWTAGPFSISAVVDLHGTSYRAWLKLSDDQAHGWLDLGEHPSTRGAVEACRDVAGSLQRARRHR